MHTSKSSDWKQSAIVYAETPILAQCVHRIGAPDSAELMACAAARYRRSFGAGARLVQLIA
jgi:hypothetical protein